MSAEVFVITVIVRLVPELALGVLVRRILLFERYQPSWSVEEYS